MVDQIVYTRCKPGRKLVDEAAGGLGDGSITKKEGYQIHNFSESILSDGFLEDPQLLEMAMQRKNAAKQMGNNATGIFTSYEFFCPLIGKTYMGQEHLRTYHADTRKDGKNNRIDVFLKQYFIGDFNGYPCELFGRDVWDAHKESENSYYHDDSETMDFLPSVELSEAVFIDMHEKVRAFIKDDRKDTVKKLVWTILNEMSKRAEERKFVIIKDKPENVELWVAALEYSLPAYLALQIPFSTNVLAKNDITLENTYYCGEDKKFDRNIKNNNNSNGKMNFYFMVVGLYPGIDSTERVDVGHYNSKFYIIDGTKNSMEIVPDEDIRRQYYNAVTAMDEDIEDFHKLLQDLKPLSFEKDIQDLYELFDAYKYMLDKMSNPVEWSYEKVMKYLTLLKKYEKEPYKWNSYCVSKIIAVYENLQEADERNNLALLSDIVKMDKTKERKEEICNAMEKRYLSLLGQPNFTVKKVMQYTEMAERIYSGLAKQLEQKFLCSVEEFSHNLRNWGLEQQYFIFTKYIDISYEKEQDWRKTEEGRKLIYALWDKLCGVEAFAVKLLNYVSELPIYMEMCEYCLEFFYENETAMKMWMKVLGQTVTQANTEKLCELCQQKRTMTAHSYEVLLAELIKRMEGEKVNPFFVQMLEKYEATETTGRLYTEEYLKKNQKKDVSKEMLNILNKNRMGSITEAYIYEWIDSYISAAEEEQMTELPVKEFEHWRSERNMPAGKTYKRFMTEEIRMVKEDSVGVILKKYCNQEPVVLEKTEAQMLIQAAGKSIDNMENVLYLYHILRNSLEEVRELLMQEIFAEKNEKRIVSMLHFIVLKKEISVEEENIYIEDMQEIEKLFVEKMKKQNIKKIRKMLQKEVGKDKILEKKINEYLNDIIGETKEQEAKNSIFAKLFHRKQKNEK